MADFGTSLDRLTCAQCLTENNTPMANRSAATQKKRRTRSKGAPLSILKFEIIQEPSGTKANSWLKLRQHFGLLLETGRNALGKIYTSIAQVVLERKETLEDRHAERKARRRLAVLAARRASSGPRTQLVEARARSRNRSASTSKTSD
jgi:hypothetical protein